MRTTPFTRSPRGLSLTEALAQEFKVLAAQIQIRSVDYGYVSFTKDGQLWDAQVAPTAQLIYGTARRCPPKVTFPHPPL